MTVEAIRQAIAYLPENERATLTPWLLEQEYGNWDERMARDFSPGGPGHSLIEKVNEQAANGDVTSLEEGLRARQKRQ